jgi:UDP-N-acetylglucosamine:LPS N-acetylglucosamine transferase
VLSEAEFTPPALAAAIVSLLTTPRALQNAAAAAKSVGRPDAGARLSTLAIGLT